jgi:hypothetical protein
MLGARLLVLEVLPLANIADSRCISLLLNILNTLLVAALINSRQCHILTLRRRLIQMGIVGTVVLLLRSLSLLSVELPLLLTVTITALL